MCLYSCYFSPKIQSTDPKVEASQLFASKRKNGVYNLHEDPKLAKLTNVRPVSTHLPANCNSEIADHEGENPVPNGGIHHSSLDNNESYIQISLKILEHTESLCQKKEKKCVEDRHMSEWRLFAILLDRIFLAIIIVLSITLTTSVFLVIGGKL